MSHCPSCQTENNYYHRFCYQCGRKLNTPKEFTIDFQETLGHAEEEINVLLTTTNTINEAPKRGMITILTIFLAILIVAAAAVGIALIGSFL